MPWRRSLLGATLVIAFVVHPMSPPRAEASGGRGIVVMPAGSRGPAWFTAQRARDTLDDIRARPGDEQMRKLQSDGESAPKGTAPEQSPELNKAWEDWLLGLTKKQQAEGQAEAPEAAGQGLGAEGTPGGSAKGIKEKEAK